MIVSGRRSAGIRAFQEDDIPPVAELWNTVLRDRSAIGSADAEGFLQRTLLSNPWSDSDLPSLVYAQADGRIVGFLGASVRRMTFEGRPIRAISSAHFMVDPTAHAHGVGALLLGRLLSGPQELTTTDTASAAARALWSGMGGSTSLLGSVSWLRVFRASRVARRALERRFGEERWFLGARARPLWRLANPVLNGAFGLISPRSSPNETHLSSEALTPNKAAEHLPRITAGFRMRPIYEEPYLASLFEDLDRFADGVAVARLVHSGGRPVGSYVYLLRPGEICPVLQVACQEEDAGAVLDDLFEDARERGAGATVGRVEPHLWESLVQNGTFLFASDARRLIHSREPALLSAVYSGDALMTRLDGEWW
jgi:GNAT superfamily N-acetyltransferase